MGNLNIEADSYTPLVEFNINGSLKMEGRSIPENACRLYDPLIEFASRLEANNVVMEVNLEYFNTASSKKLMELFKHLDRNEKVQSIKVNWHYEEGDEDSIESAEIFEDLLERTEFELHEYEEVSFS